LSAAAGAEPGAYLSAQLGGNCNYPAPVAGRDLLCYDVRRETQPMRLQAREATA
jgi:hypothetical protein